MFACGKKLDTPGYLSAEISFSRFTVPVLEYSGEVLMFQGEKSH